MGFVLPRPHKVTRIGGASAPNGEAGGNASLLFKQTNIIMNGKIKRLMKLPYASQIVCNNKWWMANGDGSGLSIVEVIQNERYPIEKVTLFTFKFSGTPQDEDFWWDVYHDLRNRG